MRCLSSLGICKIVLLLSVFLFTGGCVCGLSVTGTDFNSLKVHDIYKGKTTTSQLLGWFGKPSVKIDGGSAQQWSYSWKKSTICDGIESVSSKKELQLSIKNDIVVDFKYTESQ